MRRLAWGAATIVVVAVLGLLLVGWRPVVLLSDSMAPGAPRGALLAARPIPAAQVGVGDVVTVPVDGVGRVTHRVVAVEQLDGVRWVRLQGDANDTPDPGRVALPPTVLRTVLVIPGLGWLLTGSNLLLLGGAGLLLLGSAGLVAIGRTSASPAAEQEPVGTRPDSRDSRVAALVATLEALAEDGLDPATLEALARVRTAALFGAGPVEHAAETAALDDGARFVLLALADADPAALAVVPPNSARAVAARDAVGTWWARVAVQVPADVRSELTRVRPAVAHPAGIAGAGPVD